MITWRVGKVVSLGRAWTGAQELSVQDEQGRTVRALAYPLLVGAPEVGDQVVLNSTALDRGLGTGGYALVAAVLPSGHAEAPGPRQSPGHLVKARYTPTQAMVLGVDEQESPDHETLREADSIDGMPVITADLHSALPAIVAGIRSHAQTHGFVQPKVAYIMTDGGALPAWFSRTVATLREIGWLDSTITVGQAFGGDYEAVTVHTGLLAARHVVQADIAVLIQGPGNLGTGTTWGFSGVAVGEAMNAVSVLGGTGVGSLRVSGSDLRERHVGISHHSLTALGRVALAPGQIVVPQLDQILPTFGHSVVSAAELTAKIDRQIDELQRQAPHHTYISVTATQDLHEALLASPVRLSTMGRTYEQDPAAFLTAAVAGVLGGELVTS